MKTYCSIKLTPREKEITGKEKEKKKVMSNFFKIFQFIYEFILNDL